MKAVIKVGSKQYIVGKSDELVVDLLDNDKAMTFSPLALFDEKISKIGQPEVKSAKVTAKVLETIKGDKVKVMKFKAKKRVKTLTGHRQKHSKIQITNITAK